MGAKETVSCLDLPSGQFIPRDSQAIKPITVGVQVKMKARNCEITSVLTVSPCESTR
jgi:hypothetical protein